MGSAWPPEKVERHLSDFRAALVEPYWTNVIDDDKQKKRGVVVADDTKGILLVFEPLAQKFFLVMSKGNELISFGVDGDAVGCFLAR